jgi:hypothetical protein
MNGIWKNALKMFCPDGKGFAKDEEVAKMRKAVVEMTSNFKLGVDEEDIADLIEAIPDELLMRSWNWNRSA